MSLPFIDIILKNVEKRSSIYSIFVGLLKRAFNRDRTYNSVIMVNRTRRTDHYLEKEMFSLKCIRRNLSQISRVIKKTDGV